MLSTSSSSESDSVSEFKTAGLPLIVTFLLKLPLDEGWEVVGVVARPDGLVELLASSAGRLAGMAEEGERVDVELGVRVRDVPGSVMHSMRVQCPQQCEAWGGEVPFDDDGWAAGFGAGLKNCLMSLALDIVAG
jgi:hypothetical protein